MEATKERAWFDKPKRSGILRSIWKKLIH
jgi:hypothetical protein